MARPRPTLRALATGAIALPLVVGVGAAGARPAGGDAPTASEAAPAARSAASPASTQAPPAAAPPGSARGPELDGPTPRPASPSARKRSAAPAARARKASAAASRLPHQKGKPPSQPSPRLPPGAPRPAGPGSEATPPGSTATAAADDPELRALHEADRAMFPKLLPGLTPGWVWEPPAGAAPAPPEQDDGALPPGPVPDTPPGATDPEAAHAEWLRSLALPGFPVRLEPAVVKYLEFYRDDARGKAIARVWAKKSGRFAPALKAALVRAGLPADLVWLSLIESGHNPTIVSSAGAAGLWQFMPDSARAYGLVVDRWVDERYDPERITEAAVRYLGDLHQRFGTWELAMGAYNMGHGGMARVIQKFNSNDFWELARLEAALPWETTLYVPKIFALAIVMNNLRAFGLEDVTPDPPEAFDTLLVGPGTPLETVAAAAGTSLSELRRLNPSYLAARVPPASPSASRARWRVRVPAGSGESAGRALARAGDPEREHDVHVVRFGDTVASIAARRRTTESAIRKLNQIGRDEVLDAGTVLLVPRSDEAEFAADVEPVVVVPAQDIRYADRDRVFYRVRANDTLARVAHAFGVRRSELLAWNALDPAARLQPDMMLQVWVRRGASLGHVRHVRETDTRVLVAGTPEFIDYFESLQGRQRLVVTVAVGDTLESIGRRHGMSVGWMERINRMPRTKRLAPGATVIVYVKAPKPAAPAPEGAAAPAEAAAQAPGDAPAAVGGADAPAGATSDTQEPEAPPQGS